MGKNEYTFKTTSRETFVISLAAALTFPVECQVSAQPALHDRSQIIFATCNEPQRKSSPPSGEGVPPTVMLQISDLMVREQAKSVWANLVNLLAQRGIAAHPRLSVHDDGSATIYLDSGPSRLAFTLESKTEESGWHVVSKAGSGGVNAFGELSQVSFSKILGLINLA